MGYIYKITNLINGKIYVGKTEETIERRFYEHKLAVKNNTIKNKLYSAMKHYGVDNFSVEELDKSDDRDELCEKERYWIKYLNSQDSNIGYNIADGGNGGCTWDQRGCVTLHKGNKNTRVKPEKVDELLSDGWELGGKKLGKSSGRSNGRWIHKGDIQKRVYENELKDYISSGWELGYSDKSKINLSKSHIGNVPYNKGLKLSDDQKKKVSLSTREAMSRPDVRKKLDAHYSKMKGSRWMVNNKNESLLAYKDDIQYYLDNGYIFGRKWIGGDANE